jgi:rubrerythrin
LKRLLKEKFAFEQIQAELEMMTEQMSNVVARSHLRATQAQITYLTASSAEKRKEFSYLMINFLHEEVKEAKNDSEAADDGSEHEQSFRERNRLLLNGASTRITGLATTARGADTSQSTRQAAGGDSDDNEVIEQALRASLEEFMSNTGSRDVLEIDGDNSDEHGMDWPCSACTYMNNGGSQCAMCGTQR